MVFFVASTRRSSRWILLLATLFLTFRNVFPASLFHRKSKLPEPPQTLAARAHRKSVALREEAHQAIEERKQSLEQEATRLAKEIEFIALQKGQSVKDALLEHAAVRQAELIEQVEDLSRAGEQLLHDRVSSAEKRARDKLSQLESTAVVEGKRLAHVAESLAREKADQAEAAAYKRLEELEKAATDKIAAFYDHLLNNKKKKPTTLLSSLSHVYQHLRNRNGILPYLMGATFLHGIALLVSEDYWQRQAAAEFFGPMEKGKLRVLSLLTALVPGGMLAAKNTLIRRVAAVILALSWRYGSIEMMALTALACVYLIMGDQTG